MSESKDKLMKISEDLQQELICPSTKAKLLKKGEYLESIVDSNIRYPIIDGIPILIDEDKSLFLIDDFKQKTNTTFDLKENKTKNILKMFLPTISANIKAENNYNNICGMLPRNSKILVIGGSIKGQGMDTIYSNESFDIIGSDVSFGTYTTIICDAHDIPFNDEVFDCVILQAVLEHVLEPQRCVSEAHRVLKHSGLVYAETPFMQQVHMKQYDFTRFTHLGHRRLFRYFEEINSGPVGGPGMALAWSYTYFLRSFASSKRMSQLLTIFAHLTSFFFKYFDYYLIDRAGSYDAAAGLFFMGTKSTDALPDRELLSKFNGMR
ncbi:MAG: methyltransferase domain-containing protein [Bacteroidetes bacterium]|jgi:SAM-dependent methyltransferase|nr:methyltransferase domain-containing protein [Bacteroidota bacterium]